MRVAVEVPPSGDALSGALIALRADPLLSLTLVGPAAAIPAELAAHDRVALVDAEILTPLPGEPAVGARQIRARRRWAPRVTAELLAAGSVDAAVLLSPPAVAAAALQFTSRLLPGATRPALVAVLDPGAAGGTPVVVVDTMPGRSGAAADELAQAALSAVAVAEVLGGSAQVALLELPPGSADADRSLVAELLVAADVAAQPRPAADILAAGVCVGVAEPGSLTAWLSGVDAGLARAGLARLVGAQVLTGFPAVVVLSSGPATQDVATAVAVAAAAVRGDLAGRQERALAALRTRRREAAGLSGTTVAFTGSSAARPSMTDPAGPGTKGEEAW